jgi:ATP-dependent exoDNAse (exonuclease V) alpha subunit
MAIHATTSRVATDEEETKYRCYPATNQQPEPKITLAIGARVKVSFNVATQIGLYHGALGIVHSFGKNSEGLIVTVFVQMDDDIGITCDKSTSPVPNLVPFVRLASGYSLSNGFKRSQFPLLLAFARTTHSAQGITAKHGVVMHPMMPIGSIFARSLEYVMISRACRIEDVFLMDALLLIHFKNKKFCKAYAIIRAEYERLESLH